MKLVLVILSILISFNALAQDYQILIDCSNVKDMAQLSRLVSISTIKNGVVEAFANEAEYKDFKKYYPSGTYKLKGISKVDNYDYASYQMAYNLEQMQSWNRYPTYQTYIEMLQTFAEKYPTLVSIVEIGKSVENRNLTALRITAEGDTTMRPSIFLTSSMHGDEVTGFYIMLRLIDYILTNYNHESRINSIVNNSILYINPLSNPDGTYFGTDTTVAHARRYNANNIDLNRNFPVLGTVSKSGREPETVAMMKFAESRNFTFSMNFHGGDEVLNYPWDSFYETEFALADKLWFETICKEYVDTLRKVAPNGMKSVNQDGYVFGSDWYKVSGGRQDWMMYSMRCREITVELSNMKILRSELLDQYWQRNYSSLINIINRSLQGISGNVSDTYGNNIKAEIYIKNHDINNSSVICNQNGMFFRPTLKNRDYEVCAVADGYETQCKNIITKKDEFVNLNFVLEEGISEFKTATARDLTNINGNIFIKNGNIVVDFPSKIDNLILTDLTGKMVLQSTPNSNYVEYSTYNLNSGIYVIKITASNTLTTKKLVITK